MLKELWRPRWLVKCGQGQSVWQKNMKSLTWLKQKLFHQLKTVSFDFESIGLPVKIPFMSCPTYFLFCVLSLLPIRFRWDKLQQFWFQVILGPGWRMCDPCIIQATSAVDKHLLSTFILCIKSWLKYTYIMHFSFLMFSMIYPIR